MKRSSLWVGLLSCASVGLCATGAAASSITYTFDHNITNNDPVDAATGHQYSVEVSNAGTTMGGTVNLVSFLFRNASDGVQSSIARVYFESGPLGNIHAINNGPGVNFVGPGSNPFPGPDNVPGAQNAPFQPFETSENKLAKAGPPPSHSGINPGQYMEVIFALQAGKYFDDVITAISRGLVGDIDEDSLRLAIHVIDFESGGSESFMLVPLPGAFTMGLVGLCALVGYRLRQ
jgi:hypothetical protein